MLQKRARELVFVKSEFVSTSSVSPVEGSTILFNKIPLFYDCGGMKLYFRCRLMTKGQEKHRGLQSLNGGTEISLLDEDSW